MASKMLYWGENEAHEFWESEDHELLILRCHHESWWSTHRFHGFLFSTPSAEEAARRLKVVFSSEQVWRRGSGHRGYALCPRRQNK